MTSAPRRLAIGASGALIACGLAVLGASPASAACHTVVEPSPDGTTHEVVVCNNDPDPTHPGGGTPVGPWTWTFAAGSCGPGGPPTPAGITLQYFAMCPQPACPDPVETRVHLWTQAMVGPNPVPGTEAQFVGTSCGAPPQPVPTPALVIAAAEQVAPKPVVHVQPAGQSYVNVPNNYYSDAAPSTVGVTVLGVPIQVTFIPEGDTWNFGDGSTKPGFGVANARVGAAGAVEHGYARVGTYNITISRSYTVQFTLPSGPSTFPNAFTVTGNATALPIGEVQTTVTSN